MRFETGEYVILVLQNPREKIVGVLDEISGAGVIMRGIDLEYFEDWSRAIANGEQYLPMNDYFFPMWRVEKLTRDERSSDVPSLAEQFQSRTNKTLMDF